MSSPTAPPTGPCAAARLEVDTRCADAERLAQAAVEHQQRLRDLRHQLSELVAQRDADARVRDRRQLSAAKDEARTVYHRQMVVAKDLATVQEAARSWLRSVDQINRQVSVASRRAEEVVRRAAELGHALPGLELAADAARISAEAAQMACLEARRTLANCEEEAQRQLQAPGSNGQGTAAARPGVSARQITLVLRGDRSTLLGLALRLAEETGVEAGRLQLLLLELRESIAARALESHALRFPPDHPFWSQFPAESGRPVVESLASMGYRFDGAAGWMDGRAPTIRELAVALSHCGFDPRSMRRPASQEAIDDLWQGTTVRVEEYLAACAPALELEQVMACLGPRATRVSDLWDMWGRLRPLLLAPA